jgi:hypothetical protein
MKRLANYTTVAFLLWAVAYGLLLQTNPDVSRNIAGQKIVCPENDNVLMNRKRKYLKNGASSVSKGDVCAQGTVIFMLRRYELLRDSVSVYTSP